MSFEVTEDELRRHFRDVAKMETAGAGSASASSDGILNVKVIRDPETKRGKGIAFIQFTSKMLMRLAIEKMTGSELNGRKVRCKKAVNPDKLEETILKREKGISDFRFQRRRRPLNWLKLLN